MVNVFNKFNNYEIYKISDREIEVINFFNPLKIVLVKQCYKRQHKEN